MEGLLPILANLSLHWSWSARIIASTIPSTVHVICYQTLPPDVLLQTFAVRQIPWTLHYNASTANTLRGDDTVIIVANNPEDTIGAIRVCSDAVDAFRVRYFLVHMTYVDERVIKNLVRFAWKKHLTQVVALRSEDSAIYSVLPKCLEPEVIRVSAVQWPNFKKIDWSNCILKIAIVNYPPFITIDGRNDSTISGFAESYYKYAKAALHFQVTVVPMSHANWTAKVLAGEADAFYDPTTISPKLPVELTPVRSVEMIWCVPSTCTLASSSDLLWREFTPTTWIILAASVLAIILTVRLLVRSKFLTLVKSLLMMLSTLASVPTKLPRGHARGVLGSWLLAMLVLSTAYQTALHSMMTAPLIKYKIKNVHDLIHHNIPLRCLPSTCRTLKILANEDAVLAEMAARTEEDTHAVYSTSNVCNLYYTEMRGLLDIGTIKQRSGIFGVLPSSPLAPALRQVAVRVEASGLWQKWLPKSVRRPRCSISGNRRLEPITVANLFPVILLLFIGATVALIAFVTELWWYWLKRPVETTATFRKTKEKEKLVIKCRRTFLGKIEF